MGGSKSTLGWWGGGDSHTTPPVGKTLSSIATSKNSTTLETKLLSRFYELSSELLDIEAVIFKNLQSENEFMREKLLKFRK